VSSADRIYLRGYRRDLIFVPPWFELRVPGAGFTAAKSALQCALRAQEMHAAAGSQYQFGRRRAGTMMFS
jgi:hypothetical protein